MKNTLLLFLFFAYSATQAQDTIYKRTGELLSVKVLEISATEIKYKRFTMQDGPVFISDKNDIKKIKFLNGAVDSFIVSGPVVIAGPQVIVQNQLQVLRAGIIENPRAGLYYYNNMQIAEKRMLFLATDKNRTWRNKELDKAILETRDYKSNQYIAGFGGPALAIVCLIASAQAGRTNSNTNVSSALSLNAIGIFIASQIVTPMFKRKRAQSARRVVELYNKEVMK